MSTIIDSILDRPAAKIKAVVNSPLKQQAAKDLQKKHFTSERVATFSKTALGSSVPGAKSVTSSQKGVTQLKNEAADREKRKRRLALLRASNRGTVPLESVSEVVKEVETKAHSSQMFMSNDSHESQINKWDCVNNGDVLKGGIIPKRSAEQNAQIRAVRYVNKHMQSNGKYNGTGGTVKGSSSNRKSNSKAGRDAKPAAVYIGGVAQPITLQKQRPMCLDKQGMQNRSQKQNLTNRAGSGHTRHTHSERQSSIRNDFEDDESLIDDMDDFIDDDINEDDWREKLRCVTGYDPSKFRQIDKEEEAVESSFSRQAFEEFRSAKVARKEDEEELKLIQKEAAEEAKAKRRKIKL